MQVKGIETASRLELVCYAAAAADNARSKLADAELLLSGGRWPRAYALAVLAIEEFGKAMGVLTISFVPDQLRSKMPVRQMLEQHRVKQAGALIMMMMQPGAAPGVVATVGQSPAALLAQMLEDASAESEVNDRQKLRGLYADMAPDGSIWHPDQITETEATEQVERARQVAASAAMFGEPDFVKTFANPPAPAVAASDILFRRYLNAPKPADATAAVQVVQDGLAEVMTQFGHGPKPSDPQAV
jgi:AbiV family abortive infection protein